MSAENAAVFARLAQAFASRKSADPASSYVAKLFAKAPDAALKKVGEETAEFIMACKDCEASASDHTRAKVIGEAADVWFHMLVALSRFDASGDDVLAELAITLNLRVHLAFTGSSL